MSDMKNKADGIEAVNDDELEAAAGGMRIFANDEEEKWAKDRAAADGRTIMLPVMTMMCVCSHKYKYARSTHKEILQGHITTVYKDAKCYFCNKTKDRAF